MSVARGQVVDLIIEKPASGGWMIARHHGQVVLVRGAIPGERVRALVDRVEKRLAYAATREVVEASPDRRVTGGDPLCGGALYSHISYARQLAIKSDVVRDAFARIGRYRIDEPIDVVPSPEEGYRMRARLHVRGGRAGFYREGTHQLCDAAATRQLRPAAIEAAIALAEALAPARPAASIAIGENIAGTERAAHVELESSTLAAAGRRTGNSSLSDVLRTICAEQHLRGVSARDVDTRDVLTVGEPIVVERLDSLTSGGVANGVLQRHAESFFQGNRFVLPQLVMAVADLVPDGDEVLDLYAGVGLFSAVLAGKGRLEVTAVESDRVSGADLRENARPLEPRLKAYVETVEAFLARRSGKAPTVIIDPPRTGVSADAIASLIALSPDRLIYVSCDPPTLARDARRLIDAGYGLASLRAFDFFPNTPHLESLAVFARARRPDKRVE